jgi:hypothetical protein
MKKTAFFVFFAVFITVQRAPAQTASADTAGIKLTSKQAAREDVKIFKLPPDVLKRFKEGHFARTSDYFKPTKQYASDYALLNDSAYVQAFRKAAYNKSLHQPLHPTAHFFVVFGIVVGVIVFIGFLLAPVANNAVY